MRACTVFKNEAYVSVEFSSIFLVEMNVIDPCCCILCSNWSEGVDLVFSNSSAAAFT